MSRRWTEDFLIAEGYPPSPSAKTVWKKDQESKNRLDSEGREKTTTFIDCLIRSSSPVCKLKYTQKFISRAEKMGIKRHKKKTRPNLAQNRKKYFLGSFLSPLGLAILGGLVTDHERFSDPTFYLWLFTLFIYGFSVFQAWIYWRSMEQKKWPEPILLLLIFFALSSLVSFFASNIAYYLFPAEETKYILCADLIALIFRAAWLWLWYFLSNVIFMARNNEKT